MSDDELLDALDNPRLIVERAGDESEIVLRPFPTVRIMVGEPPSPPSMIVSGFGVDHDVNLITGPGGSGKTPLLLLVSICIAIDRPVFGTLRVGRSGPVVLALPEDGQPGGRMILDAIVASLNLQAGELAILRDRLIVLEDDVRVNLAHDAARIADTYLEHGAVAFFGDPIRNLIGGGDENDNGLAGTVCESMRREVCWRADAAVFLTQHHRKQGKDAPADGEQSRYDVRGAGGWVDGSRLALGVRKHGSRITVSGLKANRVSSNIRHDIDLSIEADPANEARWLSCRLRDANAGAVSSGATSEALTPGVGRPINDNERRALEAIDDQHEPGRLVSWSEWTDSSGINAQTLKSVKGRLLAARPRRGACARTASEWGKNLLVRDHGSGPSLPSCGHG
jgi:hypothetical protein